MMMLWSKKDKSDRRLDGTDDGVVPESFIRTKEAFKTLRKLISKLDSAAQATLDKGRAYHNAVRNLHTITTKIAECEALTPQTERIFGLDDFIQQYDGIRLRLMKLEEAYLERLMQTVNTKTLDIKIASARSKKREYYKAVGEQSYLKKKLQSVGRSGSSSARKMLEAQQSEQQAMRISKRLEKETMDKMLGALEYASQLVMTYMCTSLQAQLTGARETVNTLEPASSQTETLLSRLRAQAQVMASHKQERAETISALRQEGDILGGGRTFEDVCAVLRVNPDPEAIVMPELYAGEGVVLRVERLFLLDVAQPVCCVFFPFLTLFS